MRIPLTFGHTEKRSTNINAGQCINMYPCVNRSDSKNQITLSPTAGLKRWSFLQAGEIRGMFRYDNDIYAVSGDTFYKIPISTGIATSIGTINTSSGKCWIVSNSKDSATNQIMVTDGSDGWVYDFSTLTQITDTDFPGCVSLWFIDRYGTIVEPNSGYFWNSNIDDFTAWLGTDFVGAEGAPDDLVSYIADHREAWLFGENSLEVFKNSGDADAVFQRIDGTFQEIGCGAAASPAKKDNVIFWFDNFGQVRMAQGYMSQIVSTPEIDYQIAQLSTTTDGIGMTYTHDGHSYYVLTFPTGDLTLAYDIGESVRAGQPMWHIKSSGVDEGRWRGNCILEYNGTVYVGDYKDGYIYTLDRDTYTDNLETVRRVWTTQEVFDADERRVIFHEEMEHEFEAGVGYGTGDSSDPEVMMKYSDNGGHTWSNEVWRKIGKIGEYANRARWQMLGDSRNRIYYFAMTDPVRVEAIGGYIKAARGTD